MRFDFVQPAGRIDQGHVHLPGFRGSNPIERYRGGIGSMAVTNHVDADPVGPDLQLIDRRRAKGIGCHQQRHLPCLHKPLRDFRDRRRLPHTVHAHRQDDEGLGAFREQGLQRQPLHRRQHIEQRVRNTLCTRSGL